MVVIFVHQNGGLLENKASRERKAELRRGERQIPKDVELLDQLYPNLPSPEIFSS